MVFSQRLKKKKVIFTFSEAPALYKIKLFSVICSLSFSLTQWEENMLFAHDQSRKPLPFPFVFLFPVLTLNDFTAAQSIIRILSRCCRFRKFLKVKFFSIPDSCRGVDCGKGLKCQASGRSYSCTGKETFASLVLRLITMT